MSGACCLWWRACCRQCTPVQRIPSPPRRSKRTRTHRAQAATPYRELAYQLSDPISVLSGFSDVLLGLLHHLRALASMHSLQQLLHVLLRHLLVHGHLPSPRVLRHLLVFSLPATEKKFFAVAWAGREGGGEEEESGGARTHERQEGGGNGVESAVRTLRGRAHRLPPSAGAGPV